jgi:hypothetical protein
VNAQSYTPTSHRPPQRTSVRGGFCFLAAVGAIAAGALAFNAFAAEREFTPYAAVASILEAQRGRLPAALRNPDQAKWRAWEEREDKTIRARLQQGDLDSLVNLLLYGTSFTRQPRISIQHLTEASRAGILRARVDDLVAGSRRPGSNERLRFLQGVVRRQGMNPESAEDARQIGQYVYKELLRVLEEDKRLGERAAKAGNSAQTDDPVALLDRASFFRDRGLSVDTGIFPDFTIEETLRDLKQRAMLRDGQVRRVAVIGPGLDFIDKNEASAYDYYPPQTIQPFALYDSLVRLGLAKSGSLSVSVLDISSQVLEHLQRAREQASKNNGYVIQLPRDVARPWPEAVVSYWKAFGDRVGTAVVPIRPPDLFPGLETRAVRVRPETVLGLEPADLDIVVQRLEMAASEGFDLIVGTNIFVYYDAFEQTLALENAGAMLKPGGLLLTNDRLPETPGGSMRLAGVTVVPLKAGAIHTREPMGWYRKQ